jgi:hypothetical protein
MSVNNDDEYEAIIECPCEHLKERVKSRFYRCDIPVDSGLVPLLTACWDAGIDAINGCEDLYGHGDAMVMFLKREDAKAFLTLCYDSLVEGDLNVEIEPPDDQGLRYIEVTFPAEAIPAITEEVLGAGGTGREPV